LGKVEFETRQFANHGKIVRNGSGRGFLAYTVDPGRDKRKQYGGGSAAFFVQGQIQENPLNRSFEGSFIRQCPTHNVQIPDDAKETNTGGLHCVRGHTVLVWDVVKVL
jgi:hypothetical protein